MKKLYILIMIALLCFCTVSAATFDPRGNINGRGTYEIYNFTNITADYLFGDGTGITGLAGSGTVTSIVMGTGIQSTQSPLTTTGTVSVNTTYLSTLYCLLTGCDMTGNLTTTGRIGIGTSSPETGLHIITDPAEGAPWVGSFLIQPLSDNKEAGLSLKTTVGDNQTWSILTGHSGVPNTMFRIYDGGTDRLVIMNGTGNVGIGTTTPDEVLNIKSSGTSTEPLAIIESSGTDRIFQVYEASTGNGGLQVLNSSGTATAQLYSAGHSFINGGNLGIGTASPGATLALQDTQAGIDFMNSTGTVMAQQYWNQTSGALVIKVN